MKELKHSTELAKDVHGVNYLPGIGAFIPLV